jgi:hypothetical protein
MNALSVKPLCAFYYPKTIRQSSLIEMEKSLTMLKARPISRKEIFCN